MRKALFTEEQMVAIISEGDREPVSAVAKRHGISEQTTYVWRKRFGGFSAERGEAPEAVRGRECAAEGPVDEPCAIAPEGALAAERGLRSPDRHSRIDDAAPPRPSFMTRWVKKLKLVSTTEESGSVADD